MNDRYSIVFLENTKIKRLFRDEETGEVEIQDLMELKMPVRNDTDGLDSQDVATDVFLLDEVVAVRINDGEFYIYTQPLVRSEAV